MKKNLVLRTILIVTLGMFLLVGCGKAAVTSEAKPEETTEVVEEPTVEVSEEPEVNETAEEAPEKVEEVAEEPSEDPEREVIWENTNEDGTSITSTRQKPVTEEEKAMVAYAEGVDVSTPKFIVWNSETGTQKVLEPNEEYQYQPGDCFLEVESNYANTGFACKVMKEIRNYETEKNYFAEIIFYEGSSTVVFNINNHSEIDTYIINF